MRKYRIFNAAEEFLRQGRTVKCQTPAPECDAASRELSFSGDRSLATLHKARYAKSEVWISLKNPTPPANWKIGQLSVSRARNYINDAPFPDQLGEFTVSIPQECPCWEEILKNKSNLHHLTARLENSNVTIFWEKLLKPPKMWSGKTESVHPEFFKLLFRPVFPSIHVSV